MKKLLLLPLLSISFLIADCDTFVKDFVSKTDYKEVHLKIKPWTEIDKKIDEIFPDNDVAKKCILKLNKKYPYADQV